MVEVLFYGKNDDFHVDFGILTVKEEVTKMVWKHNSTLLSRYECRTTLTTKTNGELGHKYKKFKKH